MLYECLNINLDINVRLFFSRHAPTSSAEVRNEWSYPLLPIIFLNGVDKKTSCVGPQSYSKTNWNLYILIRSNTMQQYAGVYLLQNYCTYFRCLSHLSSEVHKIVTAASGTDHSSSATTFLQRGLIRPRWQKVVALIHDMTCTRSCSYSFMYSWWWVR